jgi:hypothetical protein
MSHRQKHRHKPRHHSHAVKSANLPNPESGPGVQEESASTPASPKIAAKKATVKEEALEV